ncbi:Uncharacterized UPF0442 protein C7D4.12c [Fusarium oxysporum f. sp. albedinis]|nr:Uncharacterized UPF0442 protein C7D4.12c [Fusarium oxysporum f. sp. albedinis]
MLLGRLSRALDQQPRTRRPSGKHRESSTLELAAEHGRRGAFASCRVWLRFALPTLDTLDEYGDRRSNRSIRTCNRSISIDWQL